MKRISLLLAALLALLAVAPMTAPVAAADEAPMEITVSLWDIANSFPEGKEMDEIGKKIESMFNISLKPVNVTWGDSDEKYNLWASSGQMPDIIGAIATVGSGRYYQWVSEGVVREIPDVSAFPKLAQYLALPEATAYQVDGKNYILPRMCYTDPRFWCMDRGILYRKDWVKKLGLSEPTNEQEFIDMIVAFAKNDPDGNGQADTIGLGTNLGFFSQLFANYGFTDARWLMQPDGNYVPSIYTKAPLALADMLRRAYKAGGVDPDFPSRVNNETRDLFAAGKLGALLYQNSPKHVQANKDAWDAAQPGVDFNECVGLLPYWKQPDADSYGFVEKSYWSETYLSSTVDDAKAERIMQLYEYLYSDEGMMLMMYGVEGTDYTKDTDGKITNLLPMKDNGMQMQLHERYPFVFATGYLAAWTSDLMQYDNPNIDASVRAMCVAERDNRLDNMKYPAVDWRVEAIDVPEKQEMTANPTDGWNKIIIDNSDATTEELYERALEEWNSQGLQACIDAVNAKAAELGLK